MVPLNAAEKGNVNLDYHVCGTGRELVNRNATAMVRRAKSRPRRRRCICRRHRQLVLSNVFAGKGVKTT